MKKHVNHKICQIAIRRPDLHARPSANLILQKVSNDALHVLRSTCKGIWTNHSLTQDNQTNGTTNGIGVVPAPRQLRTTSLQSSCPIQVCKLFDTIPRRLTKLYHPFVLDFQNVISLESCFATLRKNNISVSVKVLKGWCNGWATSKRYHEDKLLPCLFGCSNCKDELGHSLQRSHLFALWS